MCNPQGGIKPFNLNREGGGWEQQCPNYLPPYLPPGWLLSSLRKYASEFPSGQCSFLFKQSPYMATSEAGNYCLTNPDSLCQSENWVFASLKTAGDLPNSRTSPFPHNPAAPLWPGLGHFSSPAKLGIGQLMLSDRAKDLHCSAKAQAVLPRKEDLIRQKIDKGIEIYQFPILHLERCAKSN